MLSFLVKSRPPRSRTAHLRQLSFDGGRSTAEFKAPGDRFLVINRLPHAVVQGGTNSSSPSSSSSLIPPLHRHWPQDETFHVLSGTAKFILGSNRKRVVKIAKVGEEVVIPRREAHTFYNASENEDLVIEFVLDPPLGRDEAYFRNVWGYRSDCKEAEKSPTLFQALSFMYDGGVIKVLPGPELLSKWLGRTLNFVGGFLIGRLLLGYRGSYPEYYDERSS